MHRALLLLVVGSVACGASKDDAAARDASRDSASAAPAGAREAASAGALPPVSDPVIAVSAQVAHVCALTKSGAAYCWGMNGFALGHGKDVESEDKPVMVAGGHSFTSIAAGGPFTCAVDRDGRAWCWGNRDEGQLGTGKLVDSSLVPVPVVGGHTFTSVAAGSLHACALDRQGDVWCWGANASHQLGDGSDRASGTPVRAVVAEKASAIAAAGASTCALTVAGGVRCWGATSFIMEPPGKAVAVSPGCALSQDGSTWCWNPERIGERVNTTQRFVSIASNGTQHCGIVADGATYCWGFNEQGWLGVEPATSCMTDGRPVQCNPTPVPLPVKFRQVSLGGNFSAGAGVDGRLYWWGSDPAEGTAESRVPVAVALP